VGGGTAKLVETLGATKHNATIAIINKGFFTLSHHIQSLCLPPHKMNEYNRDVPPQEI
jgi:hypothetical protein